MFQKLINILNDLRPKQLLMLAGGAGVLMFLTIIVAMNFLGNEEVAIVPEEEKPIVETTAVVVAKTNIHPRTIIQESMLQMKELPVDLAPEGAIKSFEDVKGVQVRVSIFAGDILTIQKIFNDTSEEGFIGTIPADCRAVSINVNEITGVAGFARPGDKVDLLLSEKSDYSATTMILLQNVPLLSVNQDMGDSMLDGVNSAAIHNPTIATFALPPQDILKLISASKLGEIYMMLRPANPRSTYVDAMEYTIESVNAPPPKPVREPEPSYNPTPVIPSNAPPVNPIPSIPQMPATPTVPKIEIIQGDQIVQSASTPSANPTTSALPAIPSTPHVPSSPVVSSPTNN